MAKTALDEILELSNQPEQPAADSGLPSTDTNSLEDILGAEQAGGETSADVPPAPHGMGLDRSALVGSTTGTAAALLVPPGPWRGVAAGVMGGGAYAADLFSQDLEEGIPLSLDRIGHNLYEGLKFGGTEALAEGIVPFGGMLYNSPAGRSARSWVAKKWGEAMVGPVSPEMKAADDIVRFGQKRAALKAGEERPAAGLTFGEMAGKDTLAGQIEGVAASTWGQGTAQTQRKWAAEGAKQYADDLAQQMSQLSPEDAGKALSWAIEDNFDRLVKGPAQTAYRDLEQAVASQLSSTGRIVNATPVLRELQAPNSALGNSVMAQLKKLREGPLNAGDQAGVQAIDAMINVLDVSKSKGKLASTQSLANLTLDQAIRLKTVLNSIANKSTTDMASQTAATSAGTFANQIDSAVRKSLGRVPDLLRMYDNASADYAAGMTTFKNELVTKVVDSLAARPGALESILLKPEQKDVISAVKGAVGPLWDQTIAPKLRAITIMNTKQPDGSFSGDQLTKSVLELIGANPTKNNTAVEIFGEAGVKELLALGKALSITEHPPAGAWWVKLKQAATIGAIAGAPVGYAMGNSDAGSAVSGAGLAILLTPKALGTLTANPSMLKAFKDGIQASSQQQRVTPALDFILTSLRQTAAAKLAPTSPRQSAITPDQPSSQDMKTSLGGKSVSTLLKPAAPGITSER